MRVAFTLASSERGLCVGQIALSLSNRCLKKRRVDLGDYLAGFHLGIKIHKQLCDISRNLAPHLHINYRIERAVAVTAWVMGPRVIAAV